MNDFAFSSGPERFSRRTAISSALAAAFGSALDSATQAGTAQGAAPPSAAGAERPYVTALRDEKVDQLVGLSLPGENDA